MKYAVYGTLKKGFGNHSLLKNSKYLESKRIKGFDMYSVGGFPAVIRGLNSITVEIYEVTSDVVEKRLDMLEGYRKNDIIHSMYIKEKLNDDTYIYIWNRSVDNLTKIESGIW